MKNENKFDEIIYDIRKLPIYLFNASPTVLEVLFSKEIVFSHDKYCREYMNFIVNHREEIVRLNLPKFYNSSLGMFVKSWGNLRTSTEENKATIEKYGYDTSCLVNCFRICSILEGIYKDEPVYNIYTLDKENLRDKCKNFSSGEYSNGVVDKTLNKANDILLSYRDTFLAKPVNEKIYGEILEKTQMLVKIFFTKQTLDDIFGKESKK